MEKLRIVFGEGFRVFFLAAGLYAVFAVAIWTGWLGIHAVGGMAVRPPFAQAPHLWHAHEMIFGYATAAMGGFFLTAVPNWTGTRAARHLFISVVFGIWFAGRLAVWLSSYIDPVVVAVIDLAFLPILAAKLATQLIRRPKPQNLMFLLLLAIVWTGDLFTHLEWMGASNNGADTGLRVGLLGVCAMIAVLGGRVTPAFTRNAMTRAGRTDGLPQNHRIATIAGSAFAIALPILFAVSAPKAVIAVCALVAGGALAVRLAGWKSWWTLRQPILWSLHLAYAMLGAGYILLGLAYSGAVGEVAAMHILGIGAVGGMTLAVMSRAVLGHSDLPLVAPKRVAVAYLLIALAAVLRISGSLGPVEWYFAAVIVSGALWIAAFALFLSAVWPIVTSVKAA